MLQDRLYTAGIPGVDEVLYPGLISRLAYLVRGIGTSKTTLALHFL